MAISPAGGALKICHLDTERSWRGGQQQLLYLVRGLRDGGDSSVVAARTGSELSKRIKDEGFPLLAVDPWFEWDALAALKLRNALLAGRFDLLHAHTAHAAALGALATLATTIPLIVSRRVDFHLSRNPLTRWKYARAASVLTVSSAIREVLISDGLPAEQVTVVHSGVDPARLDGAAPLGRREEFGLPQGPLVGQIAALAAHKDPFNFLGSMSALKEAVPGFHAVMLGTGPLEAEVKAEVARLGLSDTVRLLGFREDAYRMLRHFDVFVFSSYLEGLGTSLLDAMTLGIPVVATRAGGIPELVEDGVSGLLAPPRDPRALASAIKRVLEDKVLRGNLIQGGRKTAARFSAAAMVNATRSAYLQALGRGSR
ncbi:MAG: glycosyltransferase family 4 protein [Elusimicrobia bacterium]|nr:glycosyltransferase family 4 protein [Elusimicrobiota bacterium]